MCDEVFGIEIWCRESIQINQTPEILHHHHDGLRYVLARRTRPFFVLHWSMRIGDWGYSASIEEREERGHVIIERMNFRKDST